VIIPKRYAIIRYWFLVEISVGLTHNVYVGIEYAMGRLYLPPSKIAPLTPLPMLMPKGEYMLSSFGEKPKNMLMCTVINISREIKSRITTIKKPEMLKYIWYTSCFLLFLCLFSLGCFAVFFLSVVSLFFLIVHRYLFYNF